MGKELGSRVARRGWSAPDNLDEMIAIYADEGALAAMLKDVWRAQQPPLVAQQRHAPQRRVDPELVGPAWTAPVSHDLNFSNRPVRTRMPGGVAGVRPTRSPPMPIDRGLTLPATRRDP